VLAREHLLQEKGEGRVELETSGSPDDLEKMKRLMERAIPG